MSDGNKVLGEFFDQQTEEQKVAQQQSVNSASSESQQRINLSVSGRYLMEVPTFAWRDKQTRQMMTSPSFKMSSKKSLMLVVSLRVVDGTPQVPKGASIMTNIILCPAAGASQETIDNTMRMMKPRLSALLGHDNISITSKWFEENLVPVYEDDGENFKLVRDHQMKKKVMVVVEDDVYENRPVLKVTSIAPAQEGDKSVSNQAADQSQSGFASDEASSDDGSENEEFGDIDATAAADMGDSAGQVEDF